MCISHYSIAAADRLIGRATFTMKWLLFLSLLHLLVRKNLSVSIDDFGAVADKDSSKIALQNADAFAAALVEANASSTDRVITFPQGKTYFMGKMVVEFMQDITIEVAGRIAFSDDIKRVWGDEAQGSGSMLRFENCQDVTLTGGGVLDGQGLKWWRLAYTGHDVRPKLVRFRVSKGQTQTHSSRFHPCYIRSTHS